jgi:hypothetical protein
MRQQYTAILLTAILWFVADNTPLQAQEHTLYNMEFVGQRQHLNPALQPITRFYFGFSGGGAFNSNALSINSARRFDENGDSFYWSPSALLSNLGKNNAFRWNLQADISLGLKVNPKLFVHASVQDKLEARINYPKDLFEFLINGNLGPNSVGKEFNIGGFRANASYYREYAMGASYQPNCKWAFGTRIKILQGIANFQTKEASLTIKTDPEYYAITMKNELDFRTSFNPNLWEGNFSINDLMVRNNNGMGIDLGATYAPSKKWNFSGSIIDLGYINWNTNAKRYYNQADQKTFVFNGLNQENLENNEDYAQKLVDTILSTFDLGEQNISSYRTALATKTYLSANYEFLSGNRVGALMYGEFANRRYQTAWSVNGQLRLSKIINLQGNIGLFNRQISNIGLGFAANLAPIQIWMLTNNAGFLFKDPLSVRTLHFRVGMNFVFAYMKDKKNPCSKDYVAPAERGKIESDNNKK